MNQDSSHIMTLQLAFSFSFKDPWFEVCLNCPAIFHPSIQELVFPEPITWVFYETLVSSSNPQTAGQCFGGGGCNLMGLILFGC